MDANNLKIKPFSPVFHKVRSLDRQLWYGTFRTLEEAKKHMKERYPKVIYEIIEVQ